MTSWLSDMIGFVQIRFSNSFVTCDEIHQEFPPIPARNVRDKTNYGAIAPRIDHSDGMALPPDN